MFLKGFFKMISQFRSFLYYIATTFGNDILAVAKEFYNYFFFVI